MTFHHHVLETQQQQKAPHFVLTFTKTAKENNSIFQKKNSVEFAPLFSEYKITTNSYILYQFE